MARCPGLSVWKVRCGSPVRTAAHACRTCDLALTQPGELLRAAQVDRQVDVAAERDPGVPSAVGLVERALRPALLGKQQPGTASQLLREAGQGLARMSWMRRAVARKPRRGRWRA